MMKGQRRPGNGFDLSEAPSHLIRRCQQFYGDLYAREAGGKELTKQQFTLLCALEQNDGASQTALVEITGIDRSTLAEMVRRMLEKGLLSRERTEEDQRANAVAISPSGKKALYDYTGSSYSTINSKLNGLPPGASSPGRQISSIDAAFAAAPPLEGDVVLYRGFSSPETVFKSGKWNDVNVAGMEWTQRSYSSTSGSLSTAKGFAGYDGVVMRVIIPKELGVKGIDAKGGQHPGENEIILQRGVRYRVVADYGKADSGDNRRYIDVMVVPSPYDKPE